MAVNVNLLYDRTNECIVGIAEEINYRLQMIVESHVNTLPRDITNALVINVDFSLSHINIGISGNVSNVMRERYLTEDWQNGLVTDAYNAILGVISNV